MTARRFAVTLLVSIVVAAASAPAASGDAARPAPEPFPSEAGPALSVPPATLEAALECTPFEHPQREPVLLVPGTGFSSDTQWSWGYEPSLRARGFDVCSVEIPNLSMDDMQVAGEYVVHAVRAMAQRSGRMVDVLGISQGAMHPRWAVKWWPDVRALVDDLVQFVAPNHGTLFADAVGVFRCTPSCHQMKTTSSYNAALNAGDETPGEIDYSSVYTLFDELVHPQLPESTSELDGASNVAIQDVCPGRPVGHGATIFDAVAYQLAMDAFTNPGPVDPGRLDPAVCTELTYDGQDRSRYGPVAVGIIQGGFPDSGFSPSEPALEPYAQS